MASLPLGTNTGQVSYLPVVPTQGGSRPSLLIFHIFSTNSLRLIPLTEVIRLGVLPISRASLAKYSICSPLVQGTQRAPQESCFYVRSPKRSVSYLCIYSYIPLRFSPAPFNGNSLYFNLMAFPISKGRGKRGFKVRPTTTTLRTPPTHWTFVQWMTLPR